MAAGMRSGTSKHTRAGGEPARAARDARATGARQTAGATRAPAENARASGCWIHTRPRLPPPSCGSLDPQRKAAHLPAQSPGRCRPRIGMGRARDRSPARPGDGPQLPPGLRLRRAEESAVEVGGDRRDGGHGSRGSGRASFGRRRTAAGTSGLRGDERAQALRARRATRGQPGAAGSRRLCHPNGCLVHQVCPTRPRGPATGTGGRGARAVSGLPAEVRTARTPTCPARPRRLPPKTRSSAR